MENRGIDLTGVFLVLLILAVTEGIFRLHPSWAAGLSRSRSFKIFRMTFLLIAAFVLLILLLVLLITVGIAIWQNFGTQTCTSVNC